MKTTDDKIITLIYLLVFKLGRGGGGGRVQKISKQNTTIRTKIITNLKFLQEHVKILEPQCLRWLAA